MRGKGVPIDQIISAYKETGSIWRAAKSLGLCGQSVHERLKRIGYPLMHEEWSDEESAEASMLSAQGVPIGQIAERLGRTYAAVACKLSERHVKSAAVRGGKKPKRKTGWTKITANEVIDRALNSSIPIHRIARKLGLPTTTVVNAVQYFAPRKWRAYVQTHSTVPVKICPGCRGEFIPLTKKQKYCTGRCGNHARNDAEYFGGNRLDAVGMKEGVCQLCHKTIAKGLSAHHVFGKGRDVENKFLVALCPGCHKLVGEAAGRVWALKAEFWENFISLVVMRAGGCDMEKHVATHIAVDIDYLTPEDAEAMGIEKDLQRPLDFAFANSLNAVGSAESEQAVEVMDSEN